jgi:hypothetical protein
MSTATIVVAALLALPFVPELQPIRSTQPQGVDEVQSTQSHGPARLAVTTGEDPRVALTADPDRAVTLRSTAGKAVPRVEVLAGRWRDASAEVQVPLRGKRPLAAGVDGVGSLTRLR